MSDVTNAAADLPAGGGEPAPQDPNIQVTAPGVPPPADPNAGEWLNGLDDELKGYVANKAWKSPKDMAESYRNLEKFAGGKGVALPAEDDAEGWEKFYNSAGRPEDPDGYKMDLPAEYNPELVDWFKAAAHKTGLSGKQAEKFMEQYLDFENSFREERVKQNETRVAAAQSELRQEWGAKYDEHINLAARGAKAVGLEQAEMLALEESMGQAKFARVFQQIGAALCAEDKTPTGTSAGGFGVNTPAQAQARYDELMSRADYRTAYLNGDKAKAAEVDTLMQQIANNGRG